MKTPCVYMITNCRNGVLYVGVTSNLSLRMNQHAQGLIEGFSKRYGLKALVYYEMHETMTGAIAREKQLKTWRRAWKARLIEGFNPDWRNLFDLQSGVVEFAPADLARQRT